MFERKGLFVVPAHNVDEEQLFEIALEAGADDVQRSGDTFEVTCPVESFQDVADAFETHHVPTDVAEFSRIPSSSVDLDEGGGRKVLKLIEALEDQDDVQHVYANFDIDEQEMQAAVGAE